MRIAYISTALPMQCGLATFNNNLFQAIEQSNDTKNQSMVIAMSDSTELDTYNFTDEVKFIIRKNNQKDYLIAADFINTSRIDVCVLQHEFGIYGGDEGLYVLNLISRISKPIITIMHTVLEQPNYNQLTALKQIAKITDKIVVMSHKAMAMLINIYNIPSTKIQYIAHGVPDLEPKSPNPIQELYPFKNKKVLLTFGLISRGKGLETVIEALPKIVEKNPDVIYVVLGKTHPGVIKNAGEEYRDSLKKLARKLNVEEHLVFINKFVNEDELHDYLTAAYLYITPYLNVAQITSGTLSYAVGAGCVVLSTPYWHAQELLQNKQGILFDFKDFTQLAKAVNNLLIAPNKLLELKNNAYKFGQNLRWPIIGKQYLQVSNQIIKRKNEESIIPKTIIEAEHIPTFNLTHIRRLTDDTGIVQHAKYGIPNLKEGYCLDDNARALIMALMAYQQYKDKLALDLLPIYLSYIQYMQNDDGSFRNFLSFDRKYLDEIGSEDSFGRTIWALGYMVNVAPNNSYREFANELFLKSLPHLKNLKHLRGYANTLIGLTQYLKAKPHLKELESYIHLLINPIIAAYKENRTENWHWFEEKLTYDNAILPLALWCSYEYLKDEHIKEIAQESQHFLTKHTLSKGYFNPVGNDGWLHKDQPMADYDQQAIETMAMVIALFKAFEIIKDENYLIQLNTCYQWFLGENSLSIPLYDYETKGCADGLQPTGVNRNQGAESSLAYLIAHLVTFRALELEFQYNSLSLLNQEDLKTKHQ